MIVLVVTIPPPPPPPPPPTTTTTTPPTAGLLWVELGQKVYHHVAFGTNHSQEVINSKISEIIRLNNCSLAQLVMAMTVTSVFSFDSWVKNMFLDLNIIENLSFLKIQYFVWKLCIFSLTILGIKPLTKNKTVSVCLYSKAHRSIFYFLIWWQKYHRDWTTYYAFTATSN